MKNYAAKIVNSSMFFPLFADVAWYSSLESLENVDSTA